MSIAYLDPGNIESDLQSGVAAKYKVHSKAEILLDKASLSLFLFYFNVFIFLSVTMGIIKRDGSRPSYAEAEREARRSNGLALGGNVL